jgi:NADH-quinone oxidoreductase subunit M
MIDTGNLLIQAIVVPVILSVFALALGKTCGKHTGWLAFFGMLYSTAILAFANYGLFSGRIKSGLEASYDWGPYIGKFTLVADGLSGPVALTIALLSTLIAAYSIAYMEHEHRLGAYFSLYLLYGSGMIGTVLTTNLAAFFLFFELMLIPSWALVGVWGTGPKEAIAFKYFMFTEAGALSLLAGIVTTRSISGTFDVFQMAKAMAKVDPTVQMAIVIAIMLGLFVKMAIFPLHTWLPDAHAEAPTPISALLSPAMIGIGGYAAIRIVYTAFPVVLRSQEFTIGLSILAIITMFYGGAMALGQTDIKRLLAYSSISQMGYMLFGIVSLSILGLTGAILLYVSHGLSKAILFMVSGILIHKFKTRDISNLSGLASKMPYTATATLIGFLGLAGVPPLVGFWSELFIFAGSMYTGLAGIVGLDIGRVFLTALAVVASILTAGYGLWTVRRVFYGQLNERTREAKEGPVLMVAPILVLAVAAIILGVYPTLASKIVGLEASKLIELLSAILG